MTEEQASPQVATIAGVEVVTIPLADYAKLLDCQRQLATVTISPDRLAADIRSRVDRDPEVAVFLAESLGRLLLKDAYTACLDRFGAMRTPGRSTIARYWERLGKVQTRRP